MSNTELIYSYADFQAFKDFGFWVSSVFILFTALIFYMLGNHFGYKSEMLFAKEVLDGQIELLKQYGNCLVADITQPSTPKQGGNDDKPA